MKDKTYFVVSDIHSFYKPLKEALWKAGFRKTNKNHILCVCGDVFDRGPDTIAVYNFLRSIPKSRRVMIRGNHELLYNDLLMKKFPESHDFHNGTVSTFCQIAQLPGIDSKYLKDHYYYRSGTYYDSERIDPEARDAWKLVLEEVKKSEITKWINSKEWSTHYEIGKYILVHSFIPLKVKEGCHNFGWYYTPISHYEYDPEWRNSLFWDDATWGCPWEMYKLGFLKSENDNGKTLVCGHWHTSDFFENLNNDKSHINICDLYISKDIIAIDACTARTNRTNVLVINQE